ncbi:hypothetical protein DFS33DRAFT_1508896, partial [Desarmillaria ectypa]
MQYLISQGLPLESQDTVVLTALHHLVSVPWNGWTLFVSLPKEPLTTENIVLLKPYSNQKALTTTCVPWLISCVRQRDCRQRKTRYVRIPKATAEGTSKPLIIKIQAVVDLKTFEPLPGEHDFFVYTKKRDPVCKIRKDDNGIRYDKIAKVLREKGVKGTAMCLAAELRSQELLAVKTSYILEVQPF